MTTGVKGGDKLGKYLAQIERNLSNASEVRVGFLEGATYPDGKPVAMVAAIQNWGAPARGVPPRPFFSNMISDKQNEWPGAIANLLKANNFDARKTLGQAGKIIAGQLRESIIKTNAPVLKPATIKRKGFPKPLVDTGHMLKSVDYEVK